MFAENVLKKKNHVNAYEREGERKHFLSDAYRKLINPQIVLQMGKIVTFFSAISFKCAKMLVCVKSKEINEMFQKIICLWRGTYEVLFTTFDLKNCIKNGNCLELNTRYVTMETSA